MTTQLNPSASTSSISTQDGSNNPTTTPRTLNHPHIDERTQPPLYVNESESGIEASVSSAADEDDCYDDDDQSQRNEEPSLIQRAVRSAKRSSHKHQPQEFVTKNNNNAKVPKRMNKPTTEEQSSFMEVQLESLPQQEQEMAIAGIENATHGGNNTSTSTEIMPSSSSNSSITSSTHHPQQQHDIPTPSSGYDGDTEGTNVDQHEQLDRHHRSLHEQLVRYSQLHHHRHHQQQHRHHHHHHPQRMELSSGNVSSS